MPRARSSGALSIWSYAVYVAPPVSARTFVIAAVNDVLPWSTWPIVPTLQCGFVRSNFAFAIFLQSCDQIGCFSVDPLIERGTPRGSPPNHALVSCLALAGMSGARRILERVTGIEPA